MSLLDGNEDVVVQRMTMVLDADGNPAPTVTASVPVRCSVQSSTAVEDSTRGTELDAQFKVIAASWPGDANSRVVWRGRTFDTVGEPLRYGRGHLSRHVTVTIRTIEPYREV